MTLRTLLDPATTRKPNATRSAETGFPGAIGIGNAVETVRPLLEVEVGQPVVPADQRLTIRDRVGDTLEEVCEVELHNRAKVEHVLVSRRNVDWGLSPACPTQ